MSDDFGTVNVTRGDRTREIEVERQRYRTQRDTLLRLAADAPNEQLAGEYQRLSREIDAAMRKLDDLEGRSTAPGDRPLIMDPHEEPLVSDSLESPAGHGSRVAIILVIGILVVTAIVWLIWRGSERGQTAAPIVEQPTTVAPLDTAATATTAPATQPASTLKVKPLLADYGTIRKGTRGVRQFEVTNAGTTPVSIQVARSECRCLFYEYRQKVAPNGKETITVAIDGAKAKAGPLHEVLAVTAKEDPSIRAELTVQATIK